MIQRSGRGRLYTLDIHVLVDYLLEPTLEPALHQILLLRLQKSLNCALDVPGSTTQTKVFVTGRKCSARNEFADLP